MTIGEGGDDFAGEISKEEGPGKCNTEHRGGLFKLITEARCSGKTQCERFATAGTDGNI